MKRSDSDKSSTFAFDKSATSLVTSIQDFLNKMKAQDKLQHKRPGVFVHTCQELATKFGIPSRLETDPNYALVSQLAQQLVIEHDEQGVFTFRYDLHFIEKIFEKGKKSVKEALHKASPKNGELESTITTKIDQLEKEVLDKLDSRSVSETLKPGSKSSMKHRSSMGPPESIPEEGGPKNRSTNANHGAPRSDSVKSTLKFRSDSLNSKRAPTPSRVDSGSRPMLARLGRKFSKESPRSSPMPTPMHSPQASLQGLSR